MHSDEIRAFETDASVARYRLTKKRKGNFIRQVVHVCYANSKFQNLDGLNLVGARKESILCCIIQWFQSKTRSYIGTMNPVAFNKEKYMPQCLING